MTADDQPGSSSEPVDDEFVVDLLASLRDSVPIPAPVAARLDQALAEARLDGLHDAPAAQSDELFRRRARRPKNWLLALGAAAAVVIAIPVGIGLMHQSSTTVTASTSADNTGAATESPGNLGNTSAELAEGPRALTLVSNTGTAYTAVALPTQVQVLVAARSAYSSRTLEGGPDQPKDLQAPGRTPSPTVIETAPMPGLASAGPLITFASDRALLAQCLGAITAGTPWSGSLVAAVDVGSYGGAPAVVVVYSDTAAPGHWHVWVINRTCTDPGRVLLSQTV